MPHKWEEDLEKVKTALEQAYPQELTKAKLAQNTGRPMNSMSTAINRLLGHEQITKRQDGNLGTYYSRKPLQKGKFPCKSA